MGLHVTMLLIGLGCVALGFASAHCAYPARRANGKLRHKVCDRLTHGGHGRPRGGQRR